MCHTKFTKIQMLKFRLFLILAFSALLFALACAQQGQTGVPPPAQSLNMAAQDIPALLRASDQNGAAMHQPGRGGLIGLHIKCGQHPAVVLCYGGWLVAD